MLNLCVFDMVSRPQRTAYGAGSYALDAYLIPVLGEGNLADCARAPTE
jgi:hypothetical protein